MGSKGRPGEATVGCHLVALEHGGLWRSKEISSSGIMKHPGKLKLGR